MMTVKGFCKFVRMVMIYVEDRYGGGVFLPTKSFQPFSGTLMEGLFLFVSVDDQLHLPC